MENKWTLRAVFVLAVCLTRNLTSGHGDKTSLDSNKTTPHSHDSTKVKLEGSRTESVEAGSSMVTLHCTNTKIAWSEMIYVIWKISLKEKNCYIGVAVNDTDANTCQDGKIINRTGNYSLIIPHFSIKDEGNYTCDVSYHAGGYVETIYVSAWARQNITGWLEVKGGHTFAVCKLQSFPAASIHWETPWNSSLAKTYSFSDANGVFTVTSHLQLPANTYTKNLSCVANERNSKWPETRFTISESKGNPIKWPFILLGVCATCSIVSLLTGLYIMREKLRKLSVFKKICCSSQSSHMPKEEKPPQPRDPEEVEPYASYVQRVNSIYNSSAGLFKP